MKNEEFLYLLSHYQLLMKFVRLEHKCCLSQSDVNLRTASLSVVLLNSLLKRSNITRKVRPASMFATLTTSRVERESEHGIPAVAILFYSLCIVRKMDFKMSHIFKRKYRISISPI
jgi:hypothetical protein